MEHIPHTKHYGKAPPAAQSTLNELNITAFTFQTIVTPFALTNEAVGNIGDTFLTANGTGWLGSLKSNEIGPYIDTALISVRALYR